MSIETLCLVQAGLISDSTREQLALRINGITESTFGEDASMSWLEIAAGNGWTAGEASTTSIVSMQVPPMQQADRTALLENVCDAWSEEVGCHINEIVVSAISSD